MTQSTSYNRILTPISSATTNEGRAKDIELKDEHHESTEPTANRRVRDSGFIGKLSEN
jgi:hypothetical protein